MLPVPTFLSVLLVAAALASADELPEFSDASELERRTVSKLVVAPAWPHRALAALRLERYGCTESRALLATLRADSAWQVRSFALYTLGRRREPVGTGDLDVEQNARVIRTALRSGHPCDPERLARGYANLARSRDLLDMVLAAELAAAGGDQTMRADASEVLRRVILRMGRSDAARASPRLAYLTRAPDLRTPLRWQQWLRRDAGRHIELRTASPPSQGDDRAPPSRIAQLDAEQFASLETYLVALASKPLDLAICIDCTASMAGELDAARGGVDDLVVFVSDVVAQLRVGLVAYRDRRDRDFETRGWDFTRDPEQLRVALWQLSAYGGGDRPEAVHPALELAYTRLTWLPESRKVLILVGDAPPHVGLGERCVRMAERAAESGLVTHAIEAEGKPVEHFAEIARGGGGNCVALDDDDLLIAEVAGMALGDRFEEEFREFFNVYLELCR